MSNDYTLLGCFVNSNNLLTEISESEGNYFTVAGCQEAATNNQSALYGLQVDNDSTYINPEPDIEVGRCFVSNPDLTYEDQFSNAIRGGLSYSTGGGVSFNGCSDNMGSTNNNSIQIYLTNEALSFFEDTNADNTMTRSTARNFRLNSMNYSERLGEIDREFGEKYQIFTQTAYSEFSPYSNNNMTTIFNVTNQEDLNRVKLEYSNLYNTIRTENKELGNLINKLNQDIKEVDKIRNRARVKLQTIINSDNAAFGNFTDINFRTNTVIMENIILVLLTLILIVVYFGEKGALKENVLSIGKNLQKMTNKPFSKPETKPATKPDTKPDTKPEIKPDTKPEIKPPSTNLDSKTKTN